MALNCQHCGVKLFRDEITKGVCENCEGLPESKRGRKLNHSSSGTSNAGDSQAEWRWAQFGVGLLILTGLSHLVFLVATIGSMFFPHSNDGDPGKPWIRIIAGSLGLGLGNIGILLSRSVPGRSGLRLGAAIVFTLELFSLPALGFLALEVFKRIGFFEQNFLPVLQEGEVAIGLLTWILLAVATGLGLFYSLAGIARARGDDELARRIALFPYKVFGLSLFVSALVVAFLRLAVPGEIAPSLFRLYLGLLNAIVLLYLIGLLADLRSLLSPPDTNP